jgi:hypothetical protein
VPGESLRMRVVTRPGGWQLPTIDELRIQDTSAKATPFRNSSRRP